MEIIEEYKRNVGRCNFTRLNKKKKILFSIS